MSDATDQQATDPQGTAPSDSTIDSTTAPAEGTDTGQETTPADSHDPADASTGSDTNPDTSDTSSDSTADAPKPGRRSKKSDTSDGSDNAPVNIGQQGVITQTADVNGDGSVPNTVDQDALDATLTDIPDPELTTETHTVRTTDPETGDVIEEDEEVEVYDATALERLVALGREGNQEAITKLGEIARATSKKLNADSEGTQVDLPQTPDDNATPATPDQVAPTA